MDEDLNTPCRHGESPVTCTTCLNDTVRETDILADLEGELD